MLDGVTVLSEQTVTRGNFWGPFILFAIGGILVSLYAGAHEYYHSRRKPTKKECIIISIIVYVVFLFIGAFLGNLTYTFSTDTYTEYRVTIDSTVNFLDFEERYIITGKEGQIYTIIDRNDYDE